MGAGGAPLCQAQGLGCLPGGVQHCQAPSAAMPISRGTGTPPWGQRAGGCCGVQTCGFWGAALSQGGLFDPCHPPVAPALPRHIVAIPSMPPLPPRLTGHPHTVLELEQTQQYSHR